MTYILLQNTSILVQFIIFFNYFLAKSLNPLPKAEWGQLRLCRVLLAHSERLPPGGSIHPQTLQPAWPVSAARWWEETGGLLISGGRRSCRFSAGSENIVTLCFNPVRGPLLLAATGAHTVLPHSLRRSCHFVCSCGSFKHTYTHPPTQVVQVQKKPDTPNHKVQRAIASVRSSLF